MPSSEARRGASFFKAFIAASAVLLLVVLAVVVCVVACTCFTLAKQHKSKTLAVTIKNAYNTSNEQCNPTVRGEHVPNNDNHISTEYNLAYDKTSVRYGFSLSSSTQSAYYSGVTSNEIQHGAQREGTGMQNITDDDYEYVQTIF